MTTKYVLKTTSTGNRIVQLNLGNRVLSIPFDESNTDYQAYLAWVAEGNTAEEWQPDGE